MKPSTLALIGAASVGIVGLIYLLSRGKGPNVRKELEKLTVLAENITSGKDIARTQVRISALLARINLDLLEALQREATEARGRRALDEVDAAKSESAVDRITADYKEQNNQIIAALQKLVTLAERPAPARKRIGARAKAKGRGR